MATNPPALTPEMIAALQAGAAQVGQKAQGGGLSAMWAPGGISPFDPLSEYVKTAPVYKLSGDDQFEQFNFMPVPDKKYRLIVGKDVVGEASNPQEAARLAELYNQYSKEGGKQVYVSLQEQIPSADKQGNPTTEWKSFYENQKNNNGPLDTLLPLALSVVGAPLLGPVFGGGALGTGLGAGIGSVAGSLGTGSNLQDALIKGAISGLAAGGLSALGGVGNASGGTVGATDIPFSGVAGLNAPAIALPAFTAPTVGSLGGAIAGSVPGEIIVNATRPVLGGALAGLGGSTVGSGVANIFGPLEATGNLPTTEDAMQEVTGRRYPSGPTALNDYLSVPVGEISGIGGQPEPEMATVTGTRPHGFKLSDLSPLGGIAALGGLLGIGSGAGTAAGQAVQQAAANIPDAPEIVVNGTPTGATGSLGATLPAASVTIPAMTAAQAVAGGVNPPKTVGDYIQGGLGALSLVNGIGGLFGGSGNIGAGIGNPNYGTVSYQPLNRQKRAITFDPFTYGQSGGEFKFFNDAQPVYQTGIGSNLAGIAPQTNQPPIQMARGGHIRGIGGGQDDLIPAKLSDGEYVISAQDVADLGDGSNEEGARRLDEMRRLIRKNAGRKNIKTIARPQKSVSSLLRAVK